MGALEQQHAATGDHGMVDRLRSDTRLLLAVVGGAILVLAWMAWAVYVASSDGVRAGVGVLIAWPALLVALALVSLPFIGGYLLIRRLSSTDGETSGAATEEDSGEEDSMEDEEEEEEDGRDEDEGSEDEPDEDEGPQDESDDEDDGSDEQPGDDSESDPEPEAAKS